MLGRRGFIKTMFGAAAASLAGLPKVPVKEAIGKFFPIPMIRVYPTLLAKDLIDVQPMDGPTGQVFALKYVVTKSKEEAGRLLEADRRRYEERLTNVSTEITAPDEVQVSWRPTTQSPNPTNA